MSRPEALKRKLSRDILQALLLARQLHQSEVAERLLQALEVLADGDLEDEDLSAAYMELALPAHKRGMQ